MILFFGMQLLPLAYGTAYLFHSIRQRRAGQGIAIAILFLLELLLNGTLLWLYLRVP